MVWLLTARFDISVLCVSIGGGGTKQVLWDG